MAVNHDQKVEVVRRNIAFIQQSIAAGGLATVAGYLLQFELITRQNHDDALAPCGRGPSDQAAMLMRTVELKIRSNPDLYFPRFTQALRWSNLGNVADLLEQQALPDHQRVLGRPAYTPYDTITSNIPSPSGSNQTTATSHNPFASFSNQPSSHYPMPPNLLPYNPFPPYFLPVQQPVLPPSYPQAYLSYTSQQENDLICAHASSEFPFLPPNPVHLNQQYSVLPSHTNAPILHQNLSLSYEQHSPPPHDGPPPPQRPRLDSPHLTSFTPTSTAVARHSLAPPTPATTTLPPQLNTTATSQVTSYTSPLTSASQESSSTSRSPLSHHPSPSYTPSPLPTTAISTSVTAVVHSPAYPSPSATTHSVGSASLYQHSLSPNMQRYVTYLKNFYKQKKTPVYDKEATLLSFKCQSFINIALAHKKSKVSTASEKKEMLMDRLHGHVDVIQKKKTNLDMCDVCKSQDSMLAHNVLVEGAPGVGKTTFAFELCKRWTRGEILQEWPVVVIIKLRDHRTRTAQDMYDLLYHPRPEVKQAVVDELIEQDGKGLLLILDGYDELTDSQRDFNSVIQCLMSRELLCQSTIMVTSRPLATRTLHDNFVQSIDQHIEVLGFTEKNIKEYIQSSCGDKPELVKDFKSYLSSHPFSSALMFNPLQCAIVTDLYRSHWEHGNKGFAPKTLTELYTGLVHILLLRYLKHHPVYKGKLLKIKDLSDLPEEVSKQLKTVTELAAEGIENQQYVFDKQADKVPSESLGLMQAEEEVISGIGTSESFNFLHLTLQEYLAAVNYSQQCSSPEQLSQLLTRDDLFPLNNFLENYGKKRKHTSSSSATHWPVVLFVAGRTKLEGISSDILMAGIGHNVLDEEKRSETPWRYKTHVSLTDYSVVNVSLLHLLFETQSPQFIQSTLVCTRHRKYLSVSGSSALDWFVIGYCIANSTSTWRVEKKGNDSPKYIDQLIMGLRLGPEECSGECKIGFLHISGHWSGNWKILSNLQPYAKSLTEIKLVGHKQKVQHDSETSKRKAVVKESACYPMLEKLTIENAESGFPTSVLSFISQQNNLRTLSLKGCGLSSESISSLIHCLQSVDNSLLELILDECIPDHTLTMSGSSFLQLILLDNDKVSCDITGYCCDISHWLSQLSPYTQLTELILHLTRQDSTDTHQESVLYQYEHKLKSLKIDNDKFTHLPLSIPQFIGSQHNNLHTLSLSRCILSSDVTRSLSLSLQSSHCRLRKLTVDKCTISTPKKNKQKTISTKNNTTLCSLVTTDSLCVLNHILSNVIFTQMTELSLCITTHNSSDAEVLTKIPDLCPVLENIKIDSSFRLSFPLSIHQLIGLQQNNLHTLSLSGCNLSSDVTRSLIQSMQSPHCRLKNLALKRCTISLPEHTRRTTIITKRTVALHSLDISFSVVDQMMSYINPFTQSLTELILHVDNDTHTCTSGVETILQELPSNCPLLETLKIDNHVDISFPLSIPQFIGSQQNNLHTLSLGWCTLSSDATRSLILSLQSPYCKLYKLALYLCTIPTTDHTQLTTAIFSSTTITHLLFIDRNIHTPSLTALASGLKHNTTIEQLIVDPYSKFFTKDQFQVLIDAVDSSAVQKMWLYDHYKKWFSDCITLSRNNNDIEWCSVYFDNLYNKW